jgi:phosphoribosyl 1,2-cyclic phosphodiesterase
MEISVVASGSNGNCCLVEDHDASVLIDAGKSGSEIERRMGKLGKSLEDVDGILVTHGHFDHISGAGVLSRRFGIPVYTTKEVYSKAKLGKFESKLFSINKEFKIKNLKIKPVRTSHNVDSCGFVVSKFGYFTDTGKVTEEMKKAISDLHSILLESNHDVDMVHNGHYPAFLKKWILSDTGHLSNETTSSVIQEIGNNLSFVLLGHLSGNHNTPEIASETYNSLVKKRIDYNVCSREKETGSWKI